MFQQLSARIARRKPTIDLEILSGRSPAENKQPAGISGVFGNTAQRFAQPCATHQGQARTMHHQMSEKKFLTVRHEFPFATSYEYKHKCLRNMEQIRVCSTFLKHR